MFVAEDIPCDPPNQATQRPLKIIPVIKATFWNRLLILIPEIKTLVIACNHRPRVIFVDALCVFAASEELSPLLTSCH